MSACVAASAQTLAVTPNPVPADEAVAIRASGLQPGERVTIEASLVDGNDAQWTSEAQFVADQQGAIDTSAQAPASGSYKGISGPGLIWSMRPTEKHVMIYRGPRELAAQPIEFKLVRDGKSADSVTLQQVRLARGVREIRVQGQLHGIVFVPAGDGPHPGVLVVGGSEGGLNADKAAWLASHGYAAFALAYFRYEDLPQKLSGIPLEYFEVALAWMKKRPEIRPDRIGVMGTSRGGELALQLGATFPEIKAVVAYVPANVRYPSCCGETPFNYAWTWRGQPLPFVRAFERNDMQTLRDAEIPVEATHGPILMIGAGEDGVWQSGRMVEEAAGRLKRQHFPFDVDVLKYPHAGHRAGTPEIFPTWHGPTTHPVSGEKTDFGGSPQGDADSTLDAIPKVLEFLRMSLPADSTTSGQASPANTK